MPHYTRKVTLFETDATGVLYFTNLLRYAVEGFEDILEKIFDAPFTESAYIFPIVEAKASYFQPLKQGHSFTGTMNIEKIGNSSLHLYTLFERDGVSVGEVRTIHVFVEKESFKSLSIPEDLRQKLYHQLEESCI